MALTDESNGFYMPVAPAYNGGMGYGFGGDGWWILLLLLCGWGNGFGGGFGGGYGNMMLGYDFPWLLNGQNGINANVNGGFRDAMLNDGITSIRDGISGLSTQLCGCCGDIATQLCNGFNGVDAGIANAAAQAEISANARQIANMQQGFGIQTGISDLKYTVATENCADRAALSDGIRDVLAATQAQTQTVLDKLCALELDGYKREADNLRTQLNMATLRESQTAQTAQILAGQAAEIDGVYNRLKNCPVPSTPVYGTQPIFTCPQSFNGCGCGA